MIRLKNGLDRSVKLSHYFLSKNEIKINYNIWSQGHFELLYMTEDFNITCFVERSGKVCKQFFRWNNVWYIVHVPGVYMYTVYSTGNENFKKFRIRRINYDKSSLLTCFLAICKMVIMSPIALMPNSCNNSFVNWERCFCCIL